MKHFYMYLSIFSVWFALAAAFGLERYTAVACQVSERYSWRRSHKWSRIVAIVMMVAIEVMFWRPVNHLWVILKMEEDGGFFTWLFLTSAAYGLHLIFCRLVEYFENVGYVRAKERAEAYSAGCAKCCHRADGQFTDLECPVMDIEACPCLEYGYDIRSVNYLSEVITALRRAQDHYSRLGKKMPSKVSIRVPKHRVVAKTNPYSEMFRDRWEFDLSLGFGDLSINDEPTKSARIIDFPVPAAVSASAPKVSQKPSRPVPVIAPPAKRSPLQIHRAVGQYGSFLVRMTNDGITCRLARRTPDGKRSDYDVAFIDATNYRDINDFLIGEECSFLYDLINTQTLSEQQLTRLG